MEITKVQQWVASMVLWVVGFGMAVPLALVSVWMGDEGGWRGNAIGMWGMSGVVGMLTLAGTLVIHRRCVLSPWLLLGLIPPAVAWPYLF